jgi:hypothetical protein
LSILALLLDNVGHKLRDRFGGSRSGLGEVTPRSTEEGTSHGSLETLKISLSHDRLDHINGTSLNKSLTGTRPLSKVEDNKEREILERVRSPSRRRSTGVLNVVDDTLGNIRLPKESGILLRFGKVLDETASPTNALRLSRSRLWYCRSILQEFLKDADERLWVVEWGFGVFSLGNRRVLKHGGDTGLEEGEVHETDAAEVGFLLVFGNHFAESSDDGTGRRS